MEIPIVGTALFSGICLGWILARFRNKQEEKNLKEALWKAAEEKGYLEGCIRNERERSLLEFQALADRLLQEHSEKFASGSEAKIETLLRPLQEKIAIFQSGLQEIVKSGTAERLTLKNTVESVTMSNRKLAEETHRLAKVLKGDVKRQGIWGELVLEKILEASGLRKDIEYTVQGTGMDLKGEEGGRLQPDVVLRLPEGKTVIIDSKLSYTHYEEFSVSEDSGQKEESLRKLVLSMREHVRNLSEKKYQFAGGGSSPDFVLLFVPIEAIFSLVIEADPLLFEEAWRRSVVIVAPSNLFAVLKTVESVWKIDRQNKNTQKIAEEGAALYDKFIDFLKDMESIGKSLRSASDAFDKGMNKLSSGRGNLIKKTEELRRLGLKTKKKLGEEYLEGEEENCFCEEISDLRS